ncbi:MAG: MarR family transcriptional regulator [Rhodospirillaceae bacterium]|nr:MarR family transcriptional regulator [Rhodospirillaceae bacterium]
MSVRKKRPAPRPAAGDLIDDLIVAWRRQAPQADLGAKAIVYRLIYINERYLAAQAARLKRHGLSLASYGVLAVLRRGGPPFAMTPGELVRTLALSSGGVSNVLARMQRGGLVTRRSDPRDGRGVIVQLTARGRVLADRATRDEATAERAAIAGLTAAQLRALDRLLRRLLAAVSQP